MKTEKLELKHLAGYLPYGLPVKILNHKCDYVGIEFSIANGYYFIGDNIYITYNGGYTGKSINEFKPILRPLSDLTKEIEVNGDKIFPIEFLSIQSILNEFISTDFIWEVIKNANSEKDIKNMPFWFFQTLMEWHFDIHGLIEKGLAIDINTLKSCNNTQ